MSDKAICPACDSYTSSIHQAFRDGGECPVCGLPAEAARAIEVAQERGASEQLAQRAAKAEQRVAELERELGRLRGALSKVQLAVNQAERVDGKPDEW